MVRKEKKTPSGGCKPKRKGKLPQETPQGYKIGTVQK
jgi:hypothetical protein